MKFLLVPACDISPKDSLEDTKTLARLKKGLSLWKDKDFDYIVVTGGVFSKNQTKSAALAMSGWLIKKSVSTEKILVENYSLDTFHNVEFSMEIIRKFDADPAITVVSHWQHCLRFKVTFYKRFYIKIKIAPIWDFDLKTFFQEWAYLLIHLIFSDSNNPFSRFIRKKRRAR